MLAAGDAGGAQHLLRQRGDQLLHHRRHRLVVGVGLVRLQHGELGVMEGGDPLVAEDPPHLVDLLQAAHDQALEVELRGYAQVALLVEGVEVGREGPGRRPAGLCLQHRRLHLHKAATVQEPAQRGDDLGAQDEDLAGGGIGLEVQVALAVARLHVLQPVELLRRRP